MMCAPGGTGNTKPNTSKSPCTFKHPHSIEALSGTQQLTLRTTAELHDVEQDFCEHMLFLKHVPVFIISLVCFGKGVMQALCAMYI